MTFRRFSSGMTLFLHLRGIQKVSFSTHFDGHHRILVRDFIHSALYDPNHGYFSKRSGPVGILESAIKFNRLEGRKAYLRYLEKIYKQSEVSWFTPVELFKPWYAHGIAEAIMRTANLSVPLKIYEIGGGSGTCAKGIMDYVMLNAPPRVYNNMTYICSSGLRTFGRLKQDPNELLMVATFIWVVHYAYGYGYLSVVRSVEISPSLAETQKETVGQVQSHMSRFRVECRDAADRTGWAGNVQHEPCWVIMLEVLDNLPHDLIYAENQASPWKEVWVDKRPEKLTPSEVFRPLEDPLISCCIEILDEDIVAKESGVVSAVRSIWSKTFPKPRRCWLPTGCLKLMEALHSALPKMSLIASDFSYLPEVKIPGIRAPLVSTKIDGRSIDHDNYLNAKGDADIFFPTDFWLLERIDHYCSGWLKPGQKNPSKEGKKRRTITLDTCAFMEEFGLPSKTRTKDGYNPLLDDFKNTKFYLSVPTHNTE